MRKRPILQISEVANTDWKPISLNQSQSVAKLASQGTTTRAKKRAAISPSTILLKDFGRGGSRAGPGRSKGEVMCGSKCHQEDPPATRSCPSAGPGTVSAQCDCVHSGRVGGHAVTNPNTRIKRSGRPSTSRKATKNAAFPTRRLSAERG